MSYKRVTLEARYQIDALLCAEKSKKAIALKLGFHKSTIYREIARNFNGKTYDPKAAQHMATERFRKCRRKSKMRGELRELIINKLKDDWSPDQIAGRLQREKVGYLSRQTIYNHILRHDVEQVGRLRRYNKRGYARGRYRAKPPTWGYSINQRPELINSRSRLGDWERDTMFALKRKQVLVCTERKSRFTKIAKIKDLAAKDVGELTIEIIKSTNGKIYSMTNDNGASLRYSVAKKNYFCEPFKPYQRGTVENTIGLLRQYISLKTNIDPLTTENLKDIEKKLNHRPRKCLGYRTPYEVFNNVTVALAV